MVNHRPVVDTVFAHDYAPAEALEGDLLSYARDADGDALQLKFVNGIRIPNKAGQDGVITVHGEFGDLIVSSDGSYLYQIRDDVAASLDPGDTMHERFSFKLSDGRGGTDFDYLRIEVNAPPEGRYQIDFTDAPKEYRGQNDIASGYAGFAFGDKMDGNLWAVASEGSNTFVVSNPYNPFFNRLDHKQFTVAGVDVATFFDPGYEGVDAEVTFDGYRDGHKVSSMIVDVHGDTIADGQRISLEALGKVDAISFGINPDVEPTGFPQLAFDNFDILV